MVVFTLCYKRELRLCDQSGGSGGLVLPVGIQLAGGAVIASESVNSALNENETELGVLVLSVALQVLSDGDSLLDQHVEILRDGRSESGLLEDSDNLVTSDTLDLSHTVGITENDTDLTGKFL